VSLIKISNAIKKHTHHVFLWSWR